MSNALRIVMLAMGAVSLLTAAAIGWLSEPVVVLEAPASQPTVLFIVMDTVRADHTSLCGYDRPTTPTLQALRADGASVSCGGVAPGSWTIPSVASFFTGKPVPEHGVHFALHSDETVRGMHLSALSDRHETLAEAMVARGYQAIGVSANPVLNAQSGLTRGFDAWQTPRAFGELYGADLVDAVGRGLEQAKPDRPLFLFVDIADAHDPWNGVPEDHAWARPRDERVHYFGPEGTHLWQRFVTGEMSEVERAMTQSLVTDLYDVALHEADQALSHVLDLVAERGWAQAGLRVVIVSDHGEFLGEHGLLRHGRYLWEANNRVPVLVHHINLDEPPPELPEQVSALVAHSLVLDGTVGDVPLFAASYPDALWLERSGGLVGGQTSAAWWRPDGTKWLWVDGEIQAFDLTQDPAEDSPAPVGEPDPAFTDFVHSVQRDARQTGGMDDQLRQALHAAGYIDSTP